MMTPMCPRPSPSCGREGGCHVMCPRPSPAAPPAPLSPAAPGTAAPPTRCRAARGRGGGARRRRRCRCRGPPDAAARVHALPIVPRVCVVVRVRPAHARAGARLPLVHADGRLDHSVGPHSMCEGPRSLLRCGRGHGRRRGASRSSCRRRCQAAVSQGSAPGPTATAEPRHRPGTDEGGRAA